MHIFTFSRPTRQLLHYGLFAVICHLTAILFAALNMPSHSSLLYHYRIFPMIEHSLISFVAIFIGALGLEYILKDIDHERSR